MGTGFWSKVDDGLRKISVADNGPVESYLKDKWDLTKAGQMGGKRYKDGGVVKRGKLKKMGKAC